MESIHYTPLELMKMMGTETWKHQNPFKYRIGFLTFEEYWDGRKSYCVGRMQSSRGLLYVILKLI